MRRHPHLYEISAWPWLERLSRREGRHVTLANVPEDAWDAVVDRGMDCVYLMGVWQRSAIGRLMARTDPSLLSAYDRALPGWSMDEVPGSAFCISAYEPDARMGGWEGLDAARAALARRDVRLIVDFVTNHTAFDHPWIRSHPEFYVQGTLDNYRAQPDLYRPIEDAAGVRFVAYGRDPFFPPWRDVAQLNFFNPELRDAVAGVLQAIAAHCDGVRCDMAMLVLNDVFAQTWASRVDLLWPQPATEFWPGAISRAPMLYLAEVYWDREYQLQQQGFDYTYDKRLLDRLLQGNVEGVRGHLHADQAFAAKLARFLENHDEERSAAAFGSRLRAAAAIAYSAPGLRFFYDGQFEGRRVHAPVQLGRWAEEAVDAGIQRFYTQLLETLDAAIFHDGTPAVPEIRSAGDGTHTDLIACAWRLGTDYALVAANLGQREARGMVILDAAIHVTLAPGEAQFTVSP